MLTDKELELGSRAVLNLHGFFVITTDDQIIENPQVIFRTLKASELFLMDYYDNLLPHEQADLEEIILKDNVVGIYGYDDKEISAIYTPAGVISSIAQAVFNLSLNYLTNKDGQEYKKKLDNVTYLEGMQAIVAYYLNMPYTEVCELSLSELYKKHAICHATFPKQINPLCEVPNENGE